jgi:hypothetical protein
MSWDDLGRHLIGVDDNETHAIGQEGDMLGIRWSANDTHEHDGEGWLKSSTTADPTSGGALGFRFLPIVIGSD